MLKGLAAAIGVASIAAAANAAADPPTGAVSCSGCHATSTRVTTPVPRIAGLDRAIFLKAMQDFRTGQRVGTVMDRIAKGFTDEEIQALAAWFASQK
jgi:cytochrome c553